MTNITARTYMGARDLHLGVPNLKGAVIKDVLTEGEDYKTTLVIEDIEGDEHKITIAQAY